MITNEMITNVNHVSCLIKRREIENDYRSDQ